MLVDDFLVETSKETNKFLRDSSIES